MLSIAATHRCNNALTLWKSVGQEALPLCANAARAAGAAGADREAWLQSGRLMVKRAALRREVSDVVQQAISSPDPEVAGLLAARLPGVLPEAPGLLEAPAREQLERARRSLEIHGALLSALQIAVGPDPDGRGAIELGAAMAQARAACGASGSSIASGSGRPIGHGRSLAALAGRVSRALEECEEAPLSEERRAKAISAPIDPCAQRNGSGSSSFVLWEGAVIT